LKIWQEDHCAQDIQLPGSIWSICFDDNRDIFTAGSDGIIRTFTTDNSRRADPDVEEMFNKQILEASSKKSGMTQDDIKKLMTTEQMSTFFFSCRLGPWKEVGRNSGVQKRNGS